MKIADVVLGQKYRHKLFGFEGIATARTEYLTGCDRIALEFYDTEKKGIRCNWVDIESLEGVDEPTTKKPDGPL